MAQISIYEANETDFTHNGIVLVDTTRCEVEEELNGKYLLELQYPIFGNDKHLELVEENIIKADGQLFRIHSSVGNLGYKEVKARHIFYDLLHNFLEDVRPTEMNLHNALNWVLDKTQYPNEFRGISDVGTINTKYFIRKNPVEAILGDDGLIANWGGEIERDNHIIRITKNRGSNKGAQIAYGKNLMGLEVERDIDQLATRIMPVGNDELMLPEKYIDSPLISNYSKPYIKTVDFNIGPQEQKVGEDGAILEDEVTEEQALEMLRQAVISMYEDDKVDIPYINIKADLLLLENTLEYKDLKHLVKVELGDIVSCTDNPLGVTFESKVIKVKKDILSNRNVEVELGQVKQGLSDTIKDAIDKIKDEVDWDKSDLEDAIERATELLTNALGGHVVKRPGELLIMDTEDPKSATKVWRWNLNGLGYSGTGIDGPYRLAMTIDGEIVADFITAGTLNASLLKAGVIRPQVGDDFWNLESGHHKIGPVSWDGNEYRIEMDGKNLPEYVEDIVVENSSEIDETTIENLRNDFENGRYKDMKRQLEADKEEINVGYNALYSNPGLVIGGIDSSAKEILKHRFDELSERYYLLMGSLDFIISQHVPDETSKGNVETRLSHYLSYTANYNNGYLDASDYLALSTEEKIGLARERADTSLEILDEYNDDRYWTPVEKRSLKLKLDAIKDEYPLLLSQASEYNISTSSYTSAYNELVRIFDNYILTEDKMNETTYHAGGNSRATMTTYYDEKISLMIAVSDKQSEHIVEVRAGLARAERNVSDAVDNANSAIQVAVNANNLVNNIASNGKLTPKEKQEISREWETIKNGHQSILDDLAWYGLGSLRQVYAIHFNHLSNYIVPLLRNMDTTSDINRDTFVQKFNDYYKYQMMALNDIARETREDLDSKVEPRGVPAALNLYGDTAEISGSIINFRGAVNVLSNITDKLGTIQAGRMYGPGIDIDLTRRFIEIDNRQNPHNRAGFKIINTQGQTIINGESNMFKIAKEMTVNPQITAGTRSFSDEWRHHLPYSPAFMAYQIDAPSSGGLVGSLTLPAIGVGRSGGDVVVNSVLRVSVDSTHVRVNMERNSTVGTYPRIRFILYEEALI